MGVEIMGVGGADTSVVFVPVLPMRDGDRIAQMQLRRLDDGRLALLAYSSLDLLVAGCGLNQGWMAVHPEQVDSLRSQGGAQVILYDVDIPDELRVNAEGVA